MRCKCADSETPGFVTYSAPYIAPDLYTVSLVPCPDCGGTQVAHCCDGLTAANERENDER